MKLQTNACTAKLPSLEEGQIAYKTLSEGSTSNHDRSSNAYTRCIRFMKVILYIELILFLGWAGCIFLTKYYQDNESNKIDGSYDGPDWVQYPVQQDDQKVVDLKDSLALPLVQNTFSDYKDEPADVEKTFLLDDRYANLRFHFELPDLVEPYISRHVRAITEQKNDSSSSSSEETKAATSRTKRSADSSSSESDSSDSSSSEKDQATTEVTKENVDCPEILDNDGKTIDDPAEIVSYIKRNWLKSLLETSIPDCDEPKSAKTVTVDNCGRFVIKCDRGENDEDDENSKESVTKNRDTRDVEANHSEEENCSKVFNASIELLNKNSMNISADAFPKTLIEYKIGLFLNALTYRSAAEQFIDGHPKTYEDWQHSVAEVIKNVSDVTDPNEREYLEKYGNTTEDIVRELSRSINPILDIYNSCNRVQVKPREAHIMTFLINSYRCIINAEKAKEREEALAAEIFPGELTDRSIIELRLSFEHKVKGWAIAYPFDTISSAFANITDQQWESYLDYIKKNVLGESTNPALRRRLESRPTQKQANELRAIAEYYVLRRDRCHTL